MSSDSLRVGVFLPITNDLVKKVIYNIDDKPAYVTNDIQAFNERYVPGGIRKLTRTVVLASGQSLTDTRQIEKGDAIDPLLLIQSYFMSQSRLVKIIGLFGSAILTWYLGFIILRAYLKRQLWRQTHDANYKRKYDSSQVGAQDNFRQESFFRTIIRYKKWWLGLMGVVVGFILITTYVFSSFTVDGVSMEPTLHDKTVHPLFKIQKSLSAVNRTEFLPSRGTVVVIEKNESNLFDPSSVQKKSYVVKRVVGLPGERVTVKNGKIMVFNMEYTDGFEPDALFKWTAKLEGSEYFNIDITLKEDELFVVGDHRDESIDSRFYGPISTTEVIGSVPVD